MPLDNTKQKIEIISESDDPAVPAGLWLYEADELRLIVANIEELRKHIADVNPRSPGWHNDLLQVPKKLLARSLGWYTRSLQRFNAAVSRSLHQLFYTVETLSTNMAALDRRLDHSEKRMSTIKDSLQEQIDSLQKQVEALISQQRKPSTEFLGDEAGDFQRRKLDDFRIAMFRERANDRTLYIIGLFGTGRLYVDDLLIRNIGERSRYFRDQIRLHPGPTPMIYSGHVTLRHTSRAQSLPIVMRGILEAIQAGFADAVFVYRHPIDSLLTNWVWWRTYLRNSTVVAGISELYNNTDDLCADLERNFSEFLMFAAGDSDFFAAAPGPPFLSFAQFVEETELHLQAATLSLRLEDFIIDARKEFAKIADVMSVDLDVSQLCLAPPKTKPYRHQDVMEKVPRFRHFVDGLDTDTRRRIENVGYVEPRPK
jgi:hypothetical protein